MKTKAKFHIMLALGGIAFIALLGERSEGAPAWAYLAVKAAGPSCGGCRASYRGCRGAARSPLTMRRCSR